MKRLLLFFLICISLKIFTQEPPFYYHYIFNKGYINPAFTGSEMKAKVKIADMHSNILKSNMPNYQEISLSDRLGNCGLSWAIMGANASNLNAKSFQFSYSYHFLLKENRRYNNNTYLSVGASAIASLFIDDVAQPEGGHVSTSSIMDSDLSPNINMGTYLYNKDYYVGISASRFVPYPYEPLNEVNGEDLNTIHLFAIGGFKIYRGNKKSYLEPTLLAIGKGDGNIATDVGITACMKKLYCISLSHRVVERLNEFNQYLVPAFVYNLRNYEFGYSIDIPVVANDHYALFYHRIYLSYTVADRCKTRLKDCPAYW